jgi:hypothetical protein
MKKDGSMFEVGRASGGMAGTGTSTGARTGGIMSVGGVPAGPPVAVKDFVDAYATAICDAVEPCCQTSKFGWSRLGCLSIIRDSQRAIELRAAIAGVTWDAQAAGKCIAGIKRDFAGCNPPINPDLYEVCGSVLVGKKAPGEACTNSLQCISPKNGQGMCKSERTDAGTLTPEVCTVEPSMNARGKLGDPCRENCNFPDINGVRCFGGPGKIIGPTDAPIAANCFDNDGLYCDEVTLKCATKKPFGTACEQSVECDNGLFCNWKKCSKLLPLGAACATGCDDGLYCENRREFVCKQGLPDGANCGGSPDFHCQSACYCDPSNRNNCVCSPFTRLGQVSEWQCTGKMTFPSFDAGVL